MVAQALSGEELGPGPLFPQTSPRGHLTKNLNDDLANPGRDHHRYPLRDLYFCGIPSGMIVCTIEASSAS